MFEKELAYRKTHVHRSAISAYYETSHGFPIAQSSLVYSLLIGAFNPRPPHPRYIFIWDVEKVLCYLKSLPAH